MNPSIRRLGKGALVATAVLILLLGLAWLVLPAILQSQAEKFIAGKTGHHLSMARPEINPLTLKLRLRDLKLDDPEGGALLAFRELLVDLSASSLLRRTWVFDAVEVDGLNATLVVRDDKLGPLNWSRLLAALSSPPVTTTATDSPPPRIDITRLHLADALFEIADRRTASAFASRVEALDLELLDLSTLPDDTGRFKLAAKTSFGATLDWQGEAALNPLGSNGRIRLSGLDLARLAPLLKSRLPAELGLAPPAGIASLSADYRLGQNKGQLDLVFDPMEIKLSALTLHKPAASGAPLLAVDTVELKQGRFDLARQRLDLGPLTLRGVHLEAGAGSDTRRDLLLLQDVALDRASIDFGQRKAELGTVALKAGKLRVRRDAQGKLDLVEVLRSLAPPAGDTPASGPPWQYRMAAATLAGFALEARDEGLSPAVEFAADDIEMSLDGISDKLDQPLPIKAALRVVSGGRLDLAGTLTPDAPALELQLKLDDLLLTPAQAYLGKFARLDIVGGRLATEGRLLHNAKTSSYRGSFSVRELHLNEAGSDVPFLAWKALASRQIEITPAKLDIPELTLSGLDTELIIAKDKSTNFKRILVPSATDVAQAEQAEQTAAPAFLVNVDRMRFYNGTLDFADHSLLLPFGTRIHNLRGSVGGLSSRPNSPGQLELDGEVDDYGLARAVGHVDLFNPTRFMDIKLIFRNVEMTRLTPYMATFAGRKIDSGKLSLNLEYNIKKRQLQSENQLIIDRLVLGERVESPTAKDLPLDLAVALLQDSGGRIELGLPVAGSLDDPQFSYSQLVWKALGNLLGKIVTAPFRALGAMFGGSGETLANIVFDAGAQRLTPPEREKLMHLATALNQRPALTLAVRGTWNEADRLAMQDLQLRRALLEKSGFRGDTKGDPGPVSTYQPQIQKALDSLFSERFGSAELAALKQGFRAANPGQLEESTAGRMMSRLSGIFSPPRELGTAEVDALKGADFHGVLYLKLRAKEVIADERLLQLARARGEAAMAVLKTSNAPAERLRLDAPERVDGESNEVPLKLELGSG